MNDGKRRRGWEFYYVKSVADQRRSAEEETGSGFQVGNEASAKILEATLNKDTLLNSSLSLSTKSKRQEKL